MMPSTGITFVDSPAIDAFGRLRVSQPETIFDNKLLYGKNELVWDEHINDDTGGASSTHDTNRVHLVVGGGDDRVIRQTRMRFNYLPGKSHLILMTFVMGHSAGTTRRVGYFNATTVAPFNDERDGVWLEHDGTTAYMVIGRGGVETRVPQAAWNHNRFTGQPGTGGPVIDWNAPQILFIDLEWLGVGRVRTGFIIDGLFVVAHDFRNANNPALAQPYIDSPNHSLRYEIFSTGGAGELIEVCGSVQSEGGYDLIGNLFTASRGITPYATGANTSIHPLVGLRLRSDRPDGTIIVITGTIVTPGATDFEWSLRFNPIPDGVDAAVWTDVGGNSAAQFDVSRTNANTLTGGTAIASGYVRSTNQGSTDIVLDLNSAVRPGVGIDGFRDEIVLCVRNLTATNTSYYAALNWREPL